MKIATWNVNSLRVRLPHVLQWLGSEKPDVLALQELKMPTDDFPWDAIRAAGYEAAVNGQKTYNGVAVLTKTTATEPLLDFPELHDIQKRVLAVTVSGVRIVNLYVPNGESVGSEKYQYKLMWLTHLKKFLQHQLQTYPKMVVLGDFNIAPDDIDVYDPKAWTDQVLFSQPERQALREILDLGFNDCFRLKHPAIKAFSWWDYRLNAFKRNLGLRIDLILATRD